MTGESRQFASKMPQVTVTDARSSDQIGDCAIWAVPGLGLGTSPTLTGDLIEARFLGRSPRLVAGDDDAISVGGDVDGVLQGGTGSDQSRGLTDQELLYLIDAEALPDGGATSTATADIKLRVPTTPASGEYSSTITLSFIE